MSDSWLDKEMGKFSRLVKVDWERAFDELDGRRLRRLRDYLGRFWTERGRERKERVDKFNITTVVMRCYWNHIVIEYLLNNGDWVKETDIFLTKKEAEASIK